MVLNKMIKELKKDDLTALQNAELKLQLLRMLRELREFRKRKKYYINKLKKLDFIKE